MFSRERISQGLTLLPPSGEENSGVQFSGLDELVYVVEGGDHGRSLGGVQRVGAASVHVRAYLPVLAVLGGLHVAEEPEDLRVVGGRLPQLVELPVNKHVGFRSVGIRQSDTNPWFIKSATLLTSCADTSGAMMTPEALGCLTDGVLHQD